MRSSHNIYNPLVYNMLRLSRDFSRFPIFFLGYFSVHLYRARIHYIRGIYIIIRIENLPSFLSTLRTNNTQYTIHTPKPIVHWNYDCCWRPLRGVAIKFYILYTPASAQRRSEFSDSSEGVYVFNIKQCFLVFHSIRFSFFFPWRFSTHCYMVPCSICWILWLYTMLIIWKIEKIDNFSMKNQVLSKTKFTLIRFADFQLCCLLCPRLFTSCIVTAALS